MNEARPFASLSSGLLARKGAAKPAMRPQGYGSIEDLGWNDMGYAPPAEEDFDAELPEHVPSSIAALTPAPKPVRHADADEPEVVAQQRAIAESFEQEPEPVAEPELEPAPRPAPAEIVRLPRRTAPVATGRKAAFTLRLDAEPPFAAAARHRGHRPLGAADRHRRARRSARLHSRSRSAGRAGSRLGRETELKSEKARRDEQDRLQIRRLDRDRQHDDGRLHHPVDRDAPPGPRGVGVAPGPAGVAALRAGLARPADRASSARRWARWSRRWRCRRAMPATGCCSPTSI